MRAVMIAFSMYSKIPMPQFLWEERDRKRAMCFFPLIGAVIGALFFGAACLMERLQTGDLLRGAVFLFLPLAVTGGIHMDGFLDTCDARASFGDREKKLRILKDSHVGAFAVISCGLYMILYAAAASEFDKRGAFTAAFGFVLSRALSGLAASVFPEARKQGMLADFMRDSNRRLIAGVSVLYAVLAAACMVWAWPAGGAAAVLAAAAVFFYYRAVALREFGGVTGDLAGYFLTVCEAVIVLALAFCGAAV